MTQRRRHTQGFTLIEIAIVLVIIGFLLAGILNAQSVMRNARTKDTIKAVTDMANASQQFRDRYGAWPGTLQNASGPSGSIPNLSVACVGNTTGLIATAVESACASESLIRSGMLRGDAVQPIRTNGPTTLSVTGAALSGVALPNNWRNVVRIQATDCDVIVQMDRLLDDGNTTTGNLRTANNVCGGGGTDQSEILPVVNAVLRIN